MRALLALAAIVFASGCSVQALEDTALEPTKNQCSSDADYGAGKCDQTLGMCHAEQGLFSTVLFEITPPTDADRYGGLSFLVPQEISVGGGSLDVALGVVSKVCDRLSVLYAGLVVEDADVRSFFAAPRHAYSRALLAATPKYTDPAASLVPVPDAVIAAVQDEVAAVDRRARHG